VPVDEQKLDAEVRRMFPSATERALIERDSPGLIRQTVLRETEADLRPPVASGASTGTQPSTEDKRLNDRFADDQGRIVTPRHIVRGPAETRQPMTADYKAPVKNPAGVKIALQERMKDPEWAKNITKRLLDHVRLSTKKVQMRLMDTPDLKKTLGDPKQFMDEMRAEVKSMQGEVPQSLKEKIMLLSSAIPGHRDPQDIVGWEAYALKRDDIMRVIADPEWQSIRRSLKGVWGSKATNQDREQAMKTLDNWAAKGPDQQIQVDNYLAALRRGGIHYADPTVLESTAEDIQARLERAGKISDDLRREVEGDLAEKAREGTTSTLADLDNYLAKREQEHTRLQNMQSKINVAPTKPGWFDKQKTRVGSSLTRRVQDVKSQAADAYRIAKGTIKENVTEAALKAFWGEVLRQPSKDAGDVKERGPENTLAQRIYANSEKPMHYARFGWLKNLWGGAVNLVGAGRVPTHFGSPAWRDREYAAAYKRMVDMANAAKIGGATLDTMRTQLGQLAVGEHVDTAALSTSPTALNIVNRVGADTRARIQRREAMKRSLMTGGTIGGGLAIPSIYRTFTSATKDLEEEARTKRVAPTGGIATTKDTAKAVDALPIMLVPHDYSLKDRVVHYGRIRQPLKRLAVPANRNARATYFGDVAKLIKRRNEEAVLTRTRQPIKSTMPVGHAPLIKPSSRLRVINGQLWEILDRGPYDTAPNSFAEKIAVNRMRRNTPQSWGTLVKDRPVTGGLKGAYVNRVTRVKPDERPGDMLHLGSVYAQREQAGPGMHTVRSDPGASPTGYYKGDVANIERWTKQGKLTADQAKDAMKAVTALRDQTVAEQGTSSLEGALAAGKLEPQSASGIMRSIVRGKGYSLKDRVKMYSTFSALVTEDDGQPGQTKVAGPGLGARLKDIGQRVSLGVKAAAKAATAPETMKKIADTATERILEGTGVRGRLVPGEGYWRPPKAMRITNPLYREHSAADLVGEASVQADRIRALRNRTDITDVDRDVAGSAYTRLLDVVDEMQTRRVRLPFKVQEALDEAAKQGVRSRGVREVPAMGQRFTDLETARLVASAGAEHSL
jgi:polyhydroxyalkanoate synthesis regulator phasin